MKELKDQINAGDKVDGKSIDGTYALDDGSGLSGAYFSFFKGTLSKYSLRTAGQKVVLAEGSLWSTSMDDFSLDNTGEYAIDGGMIYLKGLPYGSVSFSGNKMTLAGKTYTKFSGFKEERYSSLSVKENVQTQYDYRSHSVSVPVNIIRPIPRRRFIGLDEKHLDEGHSD